MGYHGRNGNYCAPLIKERNSTAPLLHKTCGALKECGLLRCRRRIKWRTKRLKGSEAKPVLIKKKTTCAVDTVSTVCPEKLYEREQGEARLKGPLPSTPGDHTAGLLLSCSSTFSPNQDKTELSCSGTPSRRNSTKTNVPAFTGRL